MENKDQWLNWAIELQGLAQAGLTYGKDVFDLERYTRIREIAAEILSMKSEIPVETVKNLFCNETGTICRVTPITSAKFSFYARLQAVNFKPTPKRPKADGMRKMNCRSLRRKRTTQSKFKCALQLPAIQTGTFFLIKKTAIQEFLLA